MFGSDFTYLCTFFHGHHGLSLFIRSEKLECIRRICRVSVTVSIERRWGEEAMIKNHTTGMAPRDHVSVFSV